MGKKLEAQVMAPWGPIRLVTWAEGLFGPRRVLCSEVRIFDHNGREIPPEEFEPFPTGYRAPRLHKWFGGLKAFHEMRLRHLKIYVHRTAHAQLDRSAQIAPD